MAATPPSPTSLDRRFARSDASFLRVASPISAATTRPNARAASSLVPCKVARVKLATAKNSGTKARTMSPARASTICVLSPGARVSATRLPPRRLRQVVDHLSPLLLGEVDPFSMTHEGRLQLNLRACAGLDANVAVPAFGFVHLGDMPLPFGHVRRLHCRRARARALEGQNEGSGENAQFRAHDPPRPKRWLSW